MKHSGGSLLWTDTLIAQAEVYPKFRPTFVLK